MDLAVRQWWLASCLHSFGRGTSSCQHDSYCTVSHAGAEMLQCMQQFVAPWFICGLLLIEQKQIKEFPSNSGTSQVDIMLRRDVAPSVSPISIDHNHGPLT